MEQDLDKLVEDELCAHSKILRRVSMDIAGENWAGAQERIEGLHKELKAEGCSVCIDLVENIRRDFYNTKDSPTRQGIHELQEGLDFVIKAFCP